MNTSRAVSIVTYNRAKHLGEVIDGVLATVPNGTDVFVCDDGSNDGTFEDLTIINTDIQLRGDKRIKVIALDTNRGQAVALNKALEIATGQYIWQWSVRAWAHPQAVKLIEALDKNPTIGFVYGQMLSYGGRKKYTHRPPRHFDAKRFAKRYRCNWYMFRRIPGIEYVEYMETPEGDIIGISDRDMVMQLMGHGLSGSALHDVPCVVYYNGGEHLMHKVIEHREEIDRRFNERWEHML